MCNHEEEFAHRGGPFEMVQLWVNLPAKDKSAKPGYQGLTAADMGKVTLPDHAGIVNVIAGNFNGTAGPAHTFTDVNLIDLKLNSGGKVKTSMPSTHNTAILVIEGSAVINGEKAGEHAFVLFAGEGEDIEIEATTDSVLLLLSGEPINEPIASYGPFVMNTQEEIVAAIQDFQSGKYGHLE
jgi:redox-sensitive bicupin YhaK (pirin superfamily)